MDVHTTFGYAMNKMTGNTISDLRGLGLTMEMWDAEAA
jgi:hypothetical protein